MFLDQLIQNCLHRGREIALVNAETGARTSYEELYELSGRVYGYLKQQGIGKESVVMISLPRGVQSVIALIGIWRAGAAAVMLEADYARDRQNYIYEDAKCCRKIDHQLFSEIMEYKSLAGSTPVSPHDLCYLVYTSGTTGNPKGVMQEFGMLDMCIEGNRNGDRRVMDSGDRLALSSPLYFAATLLMIVPVLYHGATLVVLPMDLVRNPAHFRRCLEEYQITITFATPSMMKLIPGFPATIRKLIAGGEAVRDIFYQNIDVYCLYAQSESCFNLTSFRIDKAYDITPVGKPYVQAAAVCILDENGNPVKDGETGIICYKNPYFRGYLGQPEATAKAKIGEYTGTGDLGCVLPDGNLVLKGRNDDMIKIRGNRVEPAEIESVLSRVLQVDWVRVRAFQENDTTFICAYYTEEPALSAEEAKEKLKTTLSSYMIPSFFIRIDSIPLNPNGKFSRKDLPKPDPESFRTGYVAPSTEEEKQICKAMEKVLHIDRVGVTDDFYDMGGDSISVMAILAELNWNLLDVATIVKERTPEKIAKAYLRAVLDHNVDIGERNRAAQAADHPLTTEQLYMFDYQCYAPKSTMWNLYSLLKFPPRVDMYAVRRALEEVLHTHPVFSTVFCFNDDMELVQRYVKDTDLTVEIEHLSEAEFVDVAETLLQPHKLLNSKLYRFRLFQTERGGYLYMDIHHSIADGSSIRVLIRDLCDAYEGKELHPDYYYLTIAERRLETVSPLYREAKDYYTRLLDQTKWDCFPVTDNEIEISGYGNITAMIPIEDTSYEALQQQHGMTKNRFFITVTLLAIGCYNRKDDIRISWVYNGREKKTEQNVIGALIREFYVGVHLNEHRSLHDLFKEVRRQTQNNRLYACYPYPGPERLGGEGLDASLVYQQNLRNLTGKGALTYSIVDIPQEKENADNLINIEIQDTCDGCMLYIDYVTASYREASIHRFRRLFLKTACLLVQHMTEPDYPVAELRKEVQRRCG